MAKKFTSKLSTLELGQIITIQGKTSESAKFFGVELTEDEDDRDESEEVPFHMSVVFRCRGIWRNSRIAGLWGKEERTLNRIRGNDVNPIMQGEAFKISISFDERMFYVSINDKPYCTFVHRKEPNKIKRLNVLGDVDLVFNEHNTLAQQNLPEQVDRNYSALLPSRFMVGDKIVIEGLIYGSDKGNFAIDIYDNELKRSFFHVSAFLSSKVVIINRQCENNFWRPCVILYPNPFPFSVGEEFEMEITRNINSFSLIVNANTIGTIAFRDPLDLMLKRMSEIKIVWREGTKVEVKKLFCYKKILLR